MYASDTARLKSSPSSFSDPASESSEETQTSYLKEILSVLGTVKRPGSFSFGGIADLPHPSLEIRGVDGKIGLPLCQSQAKDIIEECTRAPFGRGEKTIVDTSVRCTWQLEPEQFSIGNPLWSAKLDALVDQVKVELGFIGTQTVVAELYKLLLYEPGGFFKVCSVHVQFLVDCHLSFISLMCHIPPPPPPPPPLRSLFSITLQSCMTEFDRVRWQIV